MYDDTSNNGHAVLTVRVTGHNIDSIGDAIAGLENLSAAAVNAEVDTALSDYDGPTNAEMAADHDEMESAIRGADSDTLKTLSDQIDDISEPAMIG